MPDTNVTTIAELDEVLTVPGSSYIPVDNGTATNKITIDNFNTSTNQSAGSYALVSEGYALGTQDGEPDESGPYYHNNAKYYKEVAQSYESSISTYYNQIVSDMEISSQKAGEASASADAAAASAVLAGQKATAAYNSASTAASDASSASASSTTATAAKNAALAAASDAQGYKNDAVAAKNAAEAAAASAAEVSVRTPYIGANGDWYVWDDEEEEFVDSGTPARGAKGDKGDTGATGATGATGPAGAKGDKGDKGAKGDTGATGAKGDKGDKGDTGASGEDGNGIASVVKTGTSGLVDTYTITFDDGTTTTFDVTNGEDGETGATGVGVDIVEKVGQHEYTDYYRMTFTDGSTFNYTVTNGVDGTGSGDMLAAQYDPDSAVKDAGGIADYVEGQLPDVSAKADKVSSATSGNFAGLDANGNLTDSGSKASDFLTQHQDITGKADKVSSATSGNFAGLDANGNLTDSGKKASDFATSATATTTTNGLMSSTDKTKLDGVASGAEANVQSDWNVSDSSSDAYIKNKPSIPAEQIQSDWNQTTTSAKDYIKNKPTIPTKVSQLTNDSGYTTNTGTITSVKMNGSTISTSGEANLGTVITSHQSLAACYQTGDTAETSLADGDYFPFYDTSASGKKKTLWSNIKSVLKTYFDSLYKGASVHDTWSEVTSKPFTSTGSGLTVSSNVLKTSQYDITLNHTGTASATVTRQQNLAATGASGVNTEVAIDGTRYLESSTKTTSSGVDTFSFTNANITTTAVYDFYADKYGVAPSEVSVSTGSMSVKFKSTDSVTKCRVYIK